MIPEIMTLLPNPPTSNHEVALASFSTSPLLEFLCWLGCSVLLRKAWRGREGEGGEGGEEGEEGEEGIYRGGGQKGGGAGGAGRGRR